MAYTPIIKVFTLTIGGIPQSTGVALFMIISQQTMRQLDSSVMPYGLGAVPR
jgi:hypothetical protein